MIVHERHISTIFDFISLIAGIPNLLMIISAALINGYQQFNSNFLILEEFVGKTTKSIKGGLNLSTQLKIYVSINYPKLFKKLSCCFKFTPSQEQ